MFECTGILSFLPAELHHQILSYLNFKELNITKHVSRYWYNFFQHTKVIQNFIHVESNLVLQIKKFEKRPTYHEVTQIVKNSKFGLEKIFFQRFLKKEKNKSIDYHKLVDNCNKYNKKTQIHRNILKNKFLISL